MSEIITIKRGRKTRCKHFTGIMQEACGAGVKYADVTIDHEPIAVRNEGDRPTDAPQQVRRSLPCIQERNVGGAKCEKCEFETPEERAAEEKDFQERFARIAKAREAIVVHWAASGSAGRRAQVAGSIARCAAWREHSGSRGRA